MAGGKVDTQAGGQEWGGECRGIRRVEPGVTCLGWNSRSSAPSPCVPMSRCPHLQSVGTNSAYHIGLLGGSKQ